MRESLALYFESTQVQRLQISDHILLCVVAQCICGAACCAAHACFRVMSVKFIHTYNQLKAKTPPYQEHLLTHIKIMENLSVSSRFRISQ